LRSSLLTGKHFLVVEDEPLVALSLVSSLEKAGAQIVWPASTAAEALEIIAHFPLGGALLDGNLRARSSTRHCASSRRTPKKSWTLRPDGASGAYFLPFRRFKTASSPHLTAAKAAAGTAFAELEFA
jgi:CheY-like chemotaxis protein